MTPLRTLLADDHGPTLEELRDTPRRRRAVHRDRRGPPRRRRCQRGSQDPPGAVPALDITMPGNGIAACWEITARLPQTVVVMFTVSAADNDPCSARSEQEPAATCSRTPTPRRIPDLLIGATGRPGTHPRRPSSRGWCATSATGILDAASFPRAPPLTSREWEVLELMSQELSNSQIARELSVSPVTVRSHVSRDPPQTPRARPRDGRSPVHRLMHPDDDASTVPCAVLEASSANVVDGRRYVLVIEDQLVAEIDVMPR